MVAFSCEGGNGVVACCRLWGGRRFLSYMEPLTRHGRCTSGRLGSLGLLLRRWRRRSCCLLQVAGRTSRSVVHEAPDEVRQRAGIGLVVGWGPLGLLDVAHDRRE